MACQGHAEAFTELVRRHSSLVYGLCLRLTGNPVDAEDIMQETFLKVHLKLGTFRNEASFSTWLYRIASNTALMHLRRQRRRPVERPIEDCLPDFDETGTYACRDFDYSHAARADKVVEQRELARAALGFIVELPESYRVAFVLRDLQELKTKEVAAILGLEVPAVRQRVHRARLMLRDRLNRLMGVEE